MQHVDPGKLKVCHLLLDSEHLHSAETRLDQLMPLLPHNSDWLLVWQAIYGAPATGKCHIATKWVSCGSDARFEPDAYFEAVQ